MFQSIGMWYYSENNQQMGPVSEEELKTKARTGALTAKSLIWKEGMSDWKSISDVPEISLALNVVPSPIQPMAPMPQNPYVAPSSTYTAPMPYGQPMANNSGGGTLTFAIVTTVVSFLMCNVISLILGIIAIVFASQISSKYAIGDQIGAQGSARTSRILSWIAVGLIVLMLLITLLMFLAGAFAEASKY